MDKEQLLLNTFFAFLSALMGVILGVLYNNRRLRLFRVSETQELRRKLIKAFRFNIDRLKQMSGQLASQPPTIPDFRLDTESVVHILFHGRDLFANEQWFDRFSWQWYQLIHINTKIDYLNGVTNLSGIAGQNAGPISVGHARYASLVHHLSVAQKEISDMLSEYEAAKTQ